MDMTVLVTLLTIAVVLLSLVIVALLVAITVVLIKLRRLINHIDTVMQNIAAASDWLSPIKVFGQVSKLFRKR